MKRVKLKAKRKNLKKTPPPSLRMGAKRLIQYRRRREDAETKAFITQLASQLAAHAVHAVDSRVEEVRGGRFEDVTPSYPGEDLWGVVTLQTGGMLFGKFINGDFYEYIHGYLVRWQSAFRIEQFLEVWHPKSFEPECDIVREVRVTSVPPQIHHGPDIQERAS